VLCSALAENHRRRPVWEESELDSSQTNLYNVWTAVRRSKIIGRTFERASFETVLRSSKPVVEAGTISVNSNPRHEVRHEEEGASPACRVSSHRDARVHASGVLLVTMGSTMHATQEQLRDAKVDLAYRDFCAHLLIPLNDCRKANYFLPWRCEHERHVYEKCQYKECVQRVMHDARGSGVPVKSSPPQIERHPRVERPRPSSVEPQNPRDDRQPDRA